MVKIKLGSKELKIQYGYEVTAKSRILNKVNKISEFMADGEKLADHLEDVMLVMPELILVGAQKHHAKEFGYNYMTEDGKEKALDKIYSLMDAYFDNEEADFLELYTTLNDELMDNGFLASLLRSMEKKMREAEKVDVETAEQKVDV